MGIDVYVYAAIGYKLDPDDFTVESKRKNCSCPQNNGNVNFCPSCGKAIKVEKHCSLTDEYDEKFAGYNLIFTTDIKEAVVCLAVTKVIDPIEGDSQAEKMPLNEKVLSKIPEFTAKIKAALEEIGMKYEPKNFGIWCVANCSY